MSVQEVRASEPLNGCPYVLGGESITWSPGLGFTEEIEAWNEYARRVQADTADLINSPKGWDHERIQAIQEKFLWLKSRRRPPVFLNGTHMESGDLSRWLNEASPKKVSNFLQWNEHISSEPQAHLRREVTAAQPRVMSAAQRSVNDGLVPNMALPLLEEAFETTGVYLLDAYQSGKLLCAACCEAKDHMVGFAEEYIGREELDELVLHEYLHQVSALQDGADFREVYGSEPRDVLTWLNELSVAHMAQAGVYGQPNVLSPYARLMDSSMAYGRELHLGALMLEIGKLTPSDMCAAYFDRNPGRPIRRQFFAQLEASLGELVPGDVPVPLQIARECNDACSRIELQKTVNSWSDRLGSKALDLSHEVPTARAELPPR